MTEAETGLLLKLAELVSKAVAKEHEYNQIQALCKKVADDYAARNAAPAARAPAYRQPTTTDSLSLPASR